jgi:hypothetical protein
LRIRWFGRNWRRKRRIADWRFLFPGWVLNCDEGNFVGINLLRIYINIWIIGVILLDLLDNFGINSRDRHDRPFTIIRLKI